MLMYNGLKLDNVKGLVVDQHVLNNYTKEEIITCIKDQFEVTNEEMDYILKTTQIGIFYDDLESYRAYTNNNESKLDKECDLYSFNDYSCIRLPKHIANFLIYIKE